VAAGGPWALASERSRCRTASSNSVRFPSRQAVAGLAMPVRHGYKIDLVDLRAGQPLLQGRVASGLGCMVAGWESCGRRVGSSAAQCSAVLLRPTARLFVSGRVAVVVGVVVLFVFVALTATWHLPLHFALHSADRPPCGSMAPWLHGCLVMLDTSHRARGRREHVSRSTSSGARAWRTDSFGRCQITRRLSNLCRFSVASGRRLRGPSASRQLDQDSHHLWMQDPARSRGPRQEIALHPQPHSSIPPTSVCGLTQYTVRAA
jgi:hypothetical protein